jgi:hypothetical protein
LLSIGTPTCSGGGNYYANAASNYAITIDNVTVCASGENHIVYDIGAVDAQGVFSVMVLNAYSTQISVQAGPAASFRLILQNARLERAYTQIVSDIVTELFDFGRNVSFCTIVVLSPF